MEFVQFRVARPTDQLKKIIEFYGVGLGLEMIGSFEEHAGYTGVMFGLPDRKYHLEFTTHELSSPCPAPTKDNLLVFYIPDEENIRQTVGRLNKLGYHEVEPENPYWKVGGKSFEDPDGWGIVLMSRIYDL